MAIVALVFTAVLCFLLGSIPFGLLIGKLVYKIDIRTVGSGNIGTTNAIRALGFKGGALVFILDFGKGLLSGFLAMALLWFFVPGGGLIPNSFPAYEDFMALSFLACVAGHIFSPWLRFKGGKGIAVAVGCLFVVFGPALAIFELCVFGVLVAATRYVSVGSLASALVCVPLSIYVFAGHPVAMVLSCTAALLVIWAHRANIARLRTGTENRIGQKTKG